MLLIRGGPAGPPSVISVVGGKRRVGLGIFCEIGSLCAGLLSDGATAVLSGAIGDFGEAVSVLPDGTVDPEHSSQDDLALTQGSFRIVIGPLHAKFVNALSHASYNLKTCSGHAAVTGAAPVVAGSGTGAYKGISGNFTLTITGSEVDAKPGCQPFSSSALLAQSIVISGSGTVSLP